MANLQTDSPISRRIARSFLHFLNSVEPSAGVDSEAIEVAKQCLAEVFKIDQSSIGSQSNCDSLVDVFSSREETAGRAGNGGVSDAPTSSRGKNAEVSGASPSSDQDSARESHSLGKDELFGHFFGSLEKIHYFRRLPDGNDDQTQLDRATHLFHNAVQEMQTAGCQTFDQKMLAETFKTQGNKAMQSKLYAEAIELYTFAIALCEDNAVYYCNRAAAYTQIKRYDEAVQDCLKSMKINPNYSKAYSRLGFAYYAQGKYRDAIDKGFLKALQLDPNNDSVKENIRVAEQKLQAEQQRSGPGQSSTSTSHGQFSYQHGGGSRSSSASAPPFSMPFNFNGVGLPPDITSMMMNMTGNVFPGPPFPNGPEGETQADPHDDEPGVRVGGGNINFNVNELPEELSGAFRSMMGMFSGATPDGNQHDNHNGRSASS
ncbi:Tetratricopeptide repeat superfamily protein [Perilla frutescens var. hirtella]|uniref:Tetratricopeptide repeat superfamily protein n=1 Tax=Perilla frutescens var. hirtella TaxID=608512 RepID=A0AAD4JGR9_PERFH|nr:Tetratricopeptide repeat superfamily protein [Perilla frutescens var. hirtella]